MDASTQTEVVRKDFAQQTDGGRGEWMNEEKEVEILREIRRKKEEEDDVIVIAVVRPHASKRRMQSVKTQTAFSTKEKGVQTEWVLHKIEIEESRRPNRDMLLRYISRKWFLIRQENEFRVPEMLSPIREVDDKGEEWKGWGAGEFVWVEDEKENTQNNDSSNIDNKRKRTDDRAEKQVKRSKEEITKQDIEKKNDNNENKRKSTSNDEKKQVKKIKEAIKKDDDRNNDSNIINEKENEGNNNNVNDKKKRKGNENDGQQETKKIKKETKGEDKENTENNYNNINNDENKKKRTDNHEEKQTKKIKREIKPQDLETLSGTNWLNDEIINCYMEMIKDERTSVMNSFFFPRLYLNGYDAIKRWTKNVHIFKFEKMIVPINLGNHWCLAVINFLKKTIVYYDSFGRDNPKYLATLREYLVEEAKNKGEEQIKKDEWILATKKDIPRQRNGYDCGVFTCQYAKYEILNREMTFSQEEIPQIRKKMRRELEAGKMEE
ncbi:putative ubiquitin-like-specific protease 1B [Venturia canescens]|uniref:putative ubiquitin-like-specific protease 1B n=1 Tax=Venturia canescens TaxID=32260 RepID=UPI001C9D3E16|nr:putative ubiquitin-like-specific protease 1B [Venturia canescens]